MELLQATPDDMDEAQEALIVSERMAMLRLSTKIGVPSFQRWLSEMTSREYTEYRAMTLVEIATDMVRAEQRKGA
jgi:hypothetical protein